MPTVDAGGLARMQTQSRIPVTQWKEWCDLFGLELGDVSQIWDAVCFPMMVVSRSIPDVAYILQMRALRSDIDLEEFKEELAPILHLNGLLGSLQDEAITGGKQRAAVLQLYQHSVRSHAVTVSSREYLHRAIVELCVAVLLAKVLPGSNVSFARVVRLITEGKTSRQALCALVIQSQPVGEVGDCLQALDDYDAIALEEAAVDVPSPAAEVEGKIEEEAAGEDSEELEDSVEDPTVSPVEDVEDVEDGLEVDDEAEDDDVEDELEEDEIEEDVDRFLDYFRLALGAVYDPETADGEEAPESPQARERAITEFDPFSARIPSVEEARQLAGGGRGGAKSPAAHRGGGNPRSTPRLNRPAPSRVSMPGAGSSSGGSGASSLPGSAGGKATEHGTRAEPSTAPIDGAQSQTDDPLESDGLPPLPESPDQVLETVAVRPQDLGNVVQRIGQLLGQLEARDARVWTVFHSPEAEIDGAAELAQALATAGTGASDAYRTVRYVAQLQYLKSLLKSPLDQRLKQLRFELEVTAFINTVSSARRVFEADSRQLIPLPRVLDYAAAALARLEALRTAVLMIREDPQNYTAEVAIGRYQGVLEKVAVLADGEQIRICCERADEDIVALSAVVAVDHLVKRLIAGGRTYLQTLKADERLGDVDGLIGTLTASPLQFEDLEPVPEAGSLPEQCHQASGLGEIVDAVRDSLFRQVWPYAHPLHETTDVMKQLERLSRHELSGFARFEPRRERHHRNPRVALTVIGLDMLTGNPELAHLFARVNVEHKLLLVDDFEDGSYVDLFELRKNEKRQMHARAKERATQEDSGELQVGSSYLYSLGRSNKPFAGGVAEVMGACVMTEEGEPMVFPIF